jgi:hypothetical protein
MRSEENDGYSAPFVLKLRLQFKTGHARHANVGDQARGFVSGFGIQELFRGAKAERGQPIRFDQVLECALKRLVVVDDCYES